MSRSVVLGGCFGFWTVVKDSLKGEKRILCRCVCGKEKLVLIFPLAHGRTKSCGCRGFFRGSVVGQDFKGVKVLAGSPLGMVDCRCYCGGTFQTRYRNLTSGNTTSCGCRMVLTSKSSAKKMGINNKVHGMEGSSIYTCWAGFKSRVLHRDKYLGVSYPTDWLKFENFFKDVKESIGLPSKGFQLDRIDNNKGYFIGNLRWASPVIQAQNRSTSKLWTTTDDEGVVRVFPSCREAASFFCMNEATMRIRCNGRFQKGNWTPPKPGFSSQLKYKKAS